jgi:hypothetical protein
MCKFFALNATRNILKAGIGMAILGMKRTSYVINANA